MRLTKLMRLTKFTNLTNLTKTFQFEGKGFFVGLLLSVYLKMSLR